MYRERDFNLILNRLTSIISQLNEKVMKLFSFYLQIYNIDYNFLIRKTVNYSLLKYNCTTNVSMNNGQKDTLSYSYDNKICITFIRKQLFCTLILY